MDSVLPGSLTAQAGTQPGDTILSVDKADGLPLWKISDALRKAGTSVVIRVQRNTATMKMTLLLRSPFPGAS